MGGRELMMTLQIGKPKNSMSTGGFTLVELMLVMALLIVVLAVTFPSLQNFFRGRTLDSEARRFLTLTKYGQNRAVSEGVPMLLWIDSPKGLYGLQMQPGYTDLDSNAVQFQMPESLSIQVMANQSSILSQSNLWTQSSARLGKLPAIRFLPDGFIAETSPERISLKEKNMEPIWVGESTNRLKYEILSNQSARQ